MFGTSLFTGMGAGGSWQRFNPDNDVSPVTTQVVGGGGFVLAPVLCSPSEDYSVVVFQDLADINTQLSIASYSHQSLSAPTFVDEIDQDMGAVLSGADVLCAQNNKFIVTGYRRLGTLCVQGMQLDSGGLISSNGAIAILRSAHPIDGTMLATAINPSATKMLAGGVSDTDPTTFSMFLLDVDANGVPTYDNAPEVDINIIGNPCPRIEFLSDTLAMLIGSTDAGENTVQMLDISSGTITPIAAAPNWYTGYVQGGSLAAVNDSIADCFSIEKTVSGEATARTLRYDGTATLVEENITTTQAAASTVPSLYIKPTSITAKKETVHLYINDGGTTGAEIKLFARKIDPATGEIISSMQPESAVTALSLNFAQSPEAGPGNIFDKMTDTIIAGCFLNGADSFGVVTFKV